MFKEQFYINFRIQESDDSFFEKFGSLLRQQSQLTDENYAAPLAPMPSVAGTTDGTDDTGMHRMERLGAIEEGEHDSGTETLPDSDSDQEDQETNLHQEEFSMVGWNVSNIIICYEKIFS